MDIWLSCDWGTTTFRLRLIESESRVIAEVQSDEGSMHTFEEWKKLEKDDSSRVPFYLNIIRKNLQKLTDSSKQQLEDLPIVLSGMATSTIGMKELKYKSVPFAADGSDLLTEWIKRSKDLSNDLLMISGANTGDDVMRGEETKIAGCDIDPRAGCLLVLPGTHSKHVYVKGGKVTGFKTFMAGEFFDLLSSESILHVAVEKGGRLEESACQQSFDDGVKKGSSSNLLHNAFLVRTNDLFSKLGKRENYFFLSGLLIGYELSDLRNDLPCSITLVSNEKFTPLYQRALAILFSKEQSGVISLQHADEALIKGQFRILQQRTKNA